MRALLHRNPNLDKVRPGLKDLRTLPLRAVCRERGNDNRPGRFRAYEGSEF